MKNEYEIRGEETVIFIDSPKYGHMEALIDTIDLGIAKSFPNSWYAQYSKGTKTFYVQGNNPIIDKKQKKILLHRLIMDPPNCMDIDHVNHDTLDNRRSVNLRLVTHAENMKNKIPYSNNTSSIPRVSWYKRTNKWRVSIQINGKQKHLGYFKTLDEAKLAR